MGFCVPKRWPDQRFEPSASIEINHALTLPSIYVPESHGQRANRIRRGDELRCLQRRIVERRMNVQNVQRINRGVPAIPIGARMRIQHFGRRVRDEVWIDRDVVGDLLRKKPAFLP